MNEHNQIKIEVLEATPSVECIEALNEADVNDLCDATDAAIEAGGGFGWVKLPSRDILERYWRGVVTMPRRILFVARLDGVVCGTCQLVRPPQNNEAQIHAIRLTTNFIAPWARGHGLAEKLLAEAENYARDAGFKVINLDVRATLLSAIKKYEAAGFVRVGEHPFYAEVDGEAVTGYYYMKVI